MHPTLLFITDIQTPYTVLTNHCFRTKNIRTVSEDLSSLMSCWWIPSQTWVVPPKKSHRCNGDRVTKKMRWSSSGFQKTETNGNCLPAWLILIDNVGTYAICVYVWLYVCIYTGYEWFLDHFFDFILVSLQPLFFLKMLSPQISTGHWKLEPDLWGFREVPVEGPLLNCRIGQGVMSYESCFSEPFSGSVAVC